MANHKEETPHPILVEPPKTLPPTTTLQEDMVTAGQRKINFIWEGTQAVVAILITGAIVTCTILKIESNVLNYAFFMIVSMYYVRTNHSKVGGVGHKVQGQER